jgi:hypothetical protein
MENVRRFAAEGRRQRAEGLLNTDWGDAGHRNFLGVSLHSFAHGAACSWNSGGVNDKTFTRTFCRQAFGQRDDKLADALATLGGNYNTVSDEYSNHCALYFTLVEPVRPGEGDRLEIHRCKPAGLRQVADALGDERAFARAEHKGLAKFETLALGEFAVAARMDAVSARRSLAIQGIRDGKSPSPAAMAALAKDMRAMTADFVRLWMARNKPSRLKDNLRDLHRATVELTR